MEQAIDVYSTRLGFRVTDRSPEWVELQSGSLTLYLVSDHVSEPCFEMLVDDVDTAVSELTFAGFQKVDMAGEETFVRDPFGYLFCVSKR